MNLIVILGGGPAGLALAAGLSKFSQNQVTVIEKTNYNCLFPGEHVQSQILRLFTNLNIPKIILYENSTPCDGIVGTWINRKISSEGFFNPYGHDFIIHRPDFEKSLADFLNTQGVKFHVGKSLKKIDNRVIDIEGEILSYDFLFDCTGRTSRQFNNQRIIFDNLFGISYYGPPNPKGNSKIIIESTQKGWWYHTFSKKMSVTTYFTDYENYNLLERNLQSELNATDITKKHCKELVGSPHIKPAFTSILKSPPSNIYQVGDSYSSLDPLSSQGIFKAFKQASQIADCFSKKNFKESITKFYAAEQSSFYQNLRIREFYYNEGWQVYKSEFYRKRCELSLL